MLDEKSIMQLEAGLKRVFAMKITRSTFRDLQNVLMSITNGNMDLTNDLFESLYTGQLKDTLKGNGLEGFKELLNEYSILIRLSKEVFERGEFINLLTSDILNQNEGVGLLNCIRRIDGEEFVFISEPESTIHVLHHFLGRLRELGQIESGRQQLSHFKNDLLLLKNKVDALTSELP